MGGPAPNLYIGEVIQDNVFRIAGGEAGVKVSWTVTATRNDAYVRTYGAPVEVDKPERHRGKYLHPELYGQPLDLAIYLFGPPDEEIGVELMEEDQ